MVQQISFGFLSPSHNLLQHSHTSCIDNKQRLSRDYKQNKA